MRVRQVSRALTRLYDESLRPTGLQTSQLPVLVAVVMFGDAGANMRALASKLGMDRTTLTRNLGPLEKAGLLRVSRSPEDARVRIVSLTRSGERAIEAVFPLWQQAQERVRELLGASRADELRGRLGQVLALVPASDAPAPARPQRARKR